MRHEDLTEPESRVLKAFPRGEHVDMRSGDAGADDPAQGESWHSERTVRAEVLRSILLGAYELERGTVPTLRVTGARITGSLDLAHAEVRFPVRLEGCWFEQPADLTWAVTRYLDLRRSSLPALIAEDLRVDGSLVLTGCHVGRRPGSHAASHTGEDQSSLGRPSRAISATGMSVTGTVFMDGGFTADGEVRLLAGHVGGSLDLGGAQLRHEVGIALLAARLTVEDAVFCRDGFSAEGEVSFRRAQIAGFLDLSGAHLSNRGGSAFFAPVLTVGAGVFWREGTVLEGDLCLVDAHITGSLDLAGAQLGNPGQMAIDATRLTVEGSVSCRDGFTANGEVIFHQARVTGSFDMSDSHLSNPDGYALSATGLVVEGSATFREDTSFDGQVSMAGARITGDLDVTGARFTGSSAVTLDCAHLNTRQLSMPRQPLPGIADLSHAHIGTLNSAPDSTPGGLRVGELTYDTLIPLLPASQRIHWLAGTGEAYLPQPYEQLAAHYRRLGHDAEARTVLLAKQRHRRRALPLPLRLWGLLQDLTTGYGYRPARAGLWLAGLIAAGTIAFGLHHPAPARNSPDVEFNPFFYTLDLVLPVISYGQQIAFAPTGPYQWLSYALITAGWILATTIITGISRALYRS
jgi:hypothetical protein